MKPQGEDRAEQLNAESLHEDDERDFPPSDIAALSMDVLFYR